MVVYLGAQPTTRCPDLLFTAQSAKNIYNVDESSSVVYLTPNLLKYKNFLKHKNLKAHI